MNNSGDVCFSNIWRLFPIRKKIGTYNPNLHMYVPALQSDPKSEEFSLEIRTRKQPALPINFVSFTKIEITKKI